MMRPGTISAYLEGINGINFMDIYNEVIFGGLEPKNPHRLSMMRKLEIYSDKIIYSKERQLFYHPMHDLCLLYLNVIGHSLRFT